MRGREGTTKCVALGCGSYIIEARGRCQKHYTRLRRAGLVALPPGHKSEQCRKAQNARWARLDPDERRAVTASARAARWRAA